MDSHTLMEKSMTPDEAVARLIFHAQPEHGAFLNMLRPYRGLERKVLVDVMDSLRAAAPLFNEERLARELISALWAISHLGRLWGLAADGMLRRNELIGESEQAILAQFLEQFDYAVMTLLEGGTVDEALSSVPNAY